MLVLLALAGCVPDLPPPDLTGAVADVQRGEYLANHVAVCISCHSERDWAYLNGPNTDGRLGAGSGSTQKLEPFPDGTVLWTRNITPTHLGSWTDAEIARAITEGLSKDGTPLFLNMPYDQFGKMSKTDIASLVAYVRTLAPQDDVVPARELPIPLNLVVRTMPMEAQLTDAPPAEGTKEYGEYLANVASCVWCHSEVDSNAVIVPGRELAGGHEFPVVAPGAGHVYSANLTPDPKTGIGSWTKEQFVARLRGTDPAARTPVAPGGFNSPMPWMAFSGLTESDAGAIYDFLMSRPATEHQVTKYVAPTP